MSKLRKIITLVMFALFISLFYFNYKIISDNSNDNSFILELIQEKAQADIPPIIEDVTTEQCPDIWNPVTKYICQGSGNGCLPLDCP